MSNDSCYRFKVVWYKENEDKVENRKFFCNMIEVCEELKISKQSLIHQLKNTAHKNNKFKYMKIERCYIPRKKIIYYTYDFNDDNSECSDCSDCSSCSSIDFDNTSDYGEVDNFN